MAGRGRKVQLNDGPLLAAGHARREQLKKRTENLEMAAEIMSQDAETYSIDPAKLKAEPEILKHFDFINSAFTVTNPKPGYVYYWERDDHRAVSWRKSIARMMLGPNAAGWEVVTESVSPQPEARELLDVDGKRKIGDVVLMRIPLDSYTAIHKRYALMEKFRSANVSQKLSDFVRENEGLVTVHSMVNEDPRSYFARKGTQLKHTTQQYVEFPSTEATPGSIISEDE